MKLQTLLWMSLCWMLASCTTVYAVMPPDGQGVALQAQSGWATLARSSSGSGASRFAAGDTLHVEARLGHASLAETGPYETLMLLEISAADAMPAEPAPSSAALVIDQSGSMAGLRIQSARAAAVGYLERQPDGDTVSVTSFNSGAQVVVPTIVLSSENRPFVREALYGIRAAGGTCLSCGIEQALWQLAGTEDRVGRLLLLSDGEANQGLVEPPDFQDLVETCRRRNIAITTIGVGEGYNEKLLAALAFETTGRHHFIADERALPSLFESEAAFAAATVASGVVAEIELADGVELVEVFDRTYRTEGRRVLVPLGAFSRKQVKTVLARVRLAAGAAAPDGYSHASATRAAGWKPVAAVTLRFDDELRGMPHVISGALSVLISDEQSELDPLVAMRLERSRTAAALVKASALFEAGERERATRELAAHATRLQQAKQQAERVARQSHDGRQLDIVADFARQQQLARQAQQRFRTTTPTQLEGRHAVRSTRVWINAEME